MLLQLLCMVAASVAALVAASVTASVAALTALVSALLATDTVVNRKSMYMVVSVMGNISSDATKLVSTGKSVWTASDAGVD
jgi:hypothetical protein